MGQESTVNAIIVGAGDVGTTIAKELATDHNVTVVDLNADRAENLEYEMDVMTLHGDGTDHEILESAGIAEANILIASTDDDEANVVCCNIAKISSDVFTIARVNKPHYLDTWDHADRGLGVDFMICSDLQTAETIVDIVGLPAAHDVDRFAQGRVVMAEFEIPPESDIAGKSVTEADRFESLTFVGVVRNGDVEIATGELVLHPGDFVVVIGSVESVHMFANEVAPTEMAEAQEVIIVGGSEIGFQVARMLGAQGLDPRLIESDPDRARELAEELPATTVLESDATDVEFLKREYVETADAVVSTLHHDEMNLLVSLLARQLGVDRTVALVETGDYVNLFETVGVDVAVNPRQITAEEIIRFTREWRTENVSLLHGDLAEVIEIELDASSHFANRTIRESTKDFPKGVVIGAITRDDELITPRGETVLQPGDHVILFVETADLDGIIEKI